MIKMTHVKSQLSAAPVLVLIPGGAGLSSRTLGSLEILQRSFDLYFVDLPGTNGVSYDKDRSFDELCGEVVTELRRLQRPLFILGHSFGGLLAARISIDLKETQGLICLATPFSRQSFREVDSHYLKGMTPALRAAERDWEATRSDQSFGLWLSEYGSLYFSDAKKEEGRLLLKNDPCSGSLFLSMQSGVPSESLLTEVSEWQGRKLLLAGANDGLLPVDILHKEAASGGFEFYVVPNANHFLMLDEPETVAKLIERFTATGEGSKK